MKSADAIRSNYAALTIQTNPAETQQAIASMQSTVSSLQADGRWSMTGPNCATVCRDILAIVRGYGGKEIRPTMLWIRAYQNFSNTALSGGSTFRTPLAPGQDYGRPRYPGGDTFTFAWSILEQHKPKTPPKKREPVPDVESHLCGSPGQPPCKR